MTCRWSILPLPPCLVSLVCALVCLTWVKRFVIRVKMTQKFRSSASHHMHKLGLVPELSLDSNLDSSLGTRLKSHRSTQFPPLQHATSHLGNESRLLPRAWLFTPTVSVVQIDLYLARGIWQQAFLSPRRNACHPSRCCQGGIHQAQRAWKPADKWLFSLLQLTSLKCLTARLNTCPLAAWLFVCVCVCLLVDQASWCSLEICECEPNIHKWQRRGRIHLQYLFIGFIYQQHLSWHCWLQWKLKLYPFSRRFYLSNRTLLPAASIWGTCLSPASSSVSLHYPSL